MPEVTPKIKFPWEPENINLKVQRTCANPGKNFIIAFISAVLLSVSHEVQHSTFGVARNDFFLEDI